MSAVVAAAARKGDRISHASHVDDHDGAALLGAALGALVGARGEGGVATAVMGAGVACGRKGRVTTRDVVPHTTSGAIEDGAPDVLVGAGKLPAALAAAQKVDCHHHRDKPLRTGSETVFAGKLRLARQTDESGCGAIVCDGDPTVLVGGAPKDGAPPDPLALLEHGAAVAGVALGVATAAGGGAVLAATRWGEALAGRAGAIASEAAREAEALAGALGAEVGALLSMGDHALAGAVLGGTPGA